MKSVRPVPDHREEKWKVKNRGGLKEKASSNRPAKSNASTRSSICRMYPTPLNRERAKDFRTQGTKRMAERSVAAAGANCNCSSISRATYVTIVAGISSAAKRVMNQKPPLPTPEDG